MTKKPMTNISSRQLKRDLIELYHNSFRVTKSRVISLKQLSPQKAGFFVGPHTKARAILFEVH